MERKERDALRLYYSCKMELDNAKARINELVDRCSSLVSQNEMLESNYKEMTRDRDWCKERIKELEATISNLETPGWVSVKDRMPEDQQQVLCIDIQGSIFHSFHETYENKRGIDSAWWNYNGGLLRDVTHWMPLPPPPKEEGK